MTVLKTGASSREAPVALGPSFGGNHPRLDARRWRAFLKGRPYCGTKMLSRTLLGAMTFNVVRYRAYFEDARKRAEQAADPVEKQAWLKMAGKWLKLLALAEQHTPTEA